ncbi:EAP30/Vps36 family-domain-containing protein [Mycena belliarum]|uniref:Vacuolar protein-sorting-associated protein 36 n=1 Tax=Mycena belliarum TaxID=1033014 RepID=A0AAD6TRX1_9AGAR|nr:EAP30/Vps36 family-domain-containing protein [Mycena belliae]
MALRRCSKPVDGTIPVAALLYNDEELLASQEGVGIYDGNQKSAEHQSGTVHATTHRLFYLAAHHAAAAAHSFEVDLAQVTRTDYYAGLFTSSAKVTLHLAPPDDQAPDEQDPPFAAWECTVCANRNPPGRSPAAARVCALCGVPRDAVPGPSLSSSLPVSPVPIPPTHRRQPSTIACPACTFLNHPSLRECEICASPLPFPPPTSTHSVPSSRPPSPAPSDADPDAPPLIKLSFRAGGDKPFYAILRRALKGKAWAIGAARSSTPAADGSGISGILRAASSAAETRHADMQSAFTDLDALMVHARDMVRLAADLNARLSASTASSTALSTGAPAPDSEAAAFIRGSLATLGATLPGAPLTPDMRADEQRWEDGLARELAAVLQGGGGGKANDGLLRGRGVIALDEVWGAWMRARGVALLPPATLLEVAPHLARRTDPPLALRTFEGSGLRVLCTPRFTAAAFAERLRARVPLAAPPAPSSPQLQAPPPPPPPLLSSSPASAFPPPPPPPLPLPPAITSNETTEPPTLPTLAALEQIAPALAAELVREAEAAGLLARDDAACAVRGARAEVRYWGNGLGAWAWDGQQAVGVGVGGE